MYKILGLAWFALGMSVLYIGEDVPPAMYALAVSFLALEYVTKR